MTSGGEITPPPGFSAVPITTTMFVATTPENTPMAYHASTSANPNPIRNNDLRTELEYISEDYDEEREMEQIPEPTRAATLPLQVASPRIRRRGERTVEFERDQSRGESRVERNTEGGRPLEEAPRGNGGQSVNLPPLLAAYLGRGENGKRSLVEHLSMDLPSTYKGLMEKTYTWVEVREVATNGTSSDRRDSSERSKKTSWDNNRGHKNKDRFSPYQGPNHDLFPSLSKSLKEILATEKAARSFEPPPKMFGNSRGCKLRTTFAPRESREAHIAKSLAQESTDYGGKEIIFPPAAKHCFEKLNPIIKATKVDLKTHLVGFSRERSWSIGEVLLEITIGDAPLSRTETLNFVIVRSNSSHNMLLGRTAMQRMGILVSMIHGAIKFHTKKGIGTVLMANETDEGTKRARKILATKEERVLSCVNAEEKIILNDKYPDQTVTIEKQLPEHFKKELQNLLK
ncbi:hypothetical protein Tco_0414225 [Tanacetum coccineum]